SCHGKGSLESARGCEARENDGCRRKQKAPGSARVEGSNAVQMTKQVGTLLLCRRTDKLVRLTGPSAFFQILSELVADLLQLGGDRLARQKGAKIERLNFLLQLLWRLLRFG